MNDRLILLAVHVVTAVFGVGPILAMAMLASSTTSSETAKVLVTFARLVQWALLVSLVTGLWLAQLSGWIYMRQPWMHASLTFFVAVGALTGMVGRPLRHAAAQAGSSDLLKVRRMAWISCGLVTVIVVLMVIKPG